MSPMLPRVTSRRAFSLIESVVAVVLAGILLAGIAQLLNNARVSADTEGAVATQGAQLRQAETVIQARLARAERPFAQVENITGGSAQAAGNEIVFITSRPADDDAGGQRIYTAERIAYRSEAESGTDGRPLVRGGGVTLQIKTQTGAVPNTTLWSEAAAPSRVLVDRMPTPTAARPLFRYYEDARTPSRANDARWQERVGMVDVTIARDADGPGSSTTADRVAEQVLATSVFLPRVARRTAGVGNTQVCD